jgi:hypothetical protein
MPTDVKTIKALERISKQLKDMGVKSKDLTLLNRHIGQQKRQPAWEQLPNGKWKQHTKPHFEKRD